MHERTKGVWPDFKRNAGMGNIKGYKRGGGEEGGRGGGSKQSPINTANFRGKLPRRRGDSDQSVAVHPGSVSRAALSPFTSPLLPSLSLASFKAAAEARSTSVMESFTVWEVSFWFRLKSSHREKAPAFWNYYSFQTRKWVEPRPSVIGPRRPGPRLIRWLDCNFVKGTGCFLCWLNISV